MNKNNPAYLLHDLIRRRAERAPDDVALVHEATSMTYADLAGSIQNFANGLAALGLQRGDRVGIFLEKRMETVIASFGATLAGCVFVPINPILKAPQAIHILRDCDVKTLVTSPERLSLLKAGLEECGALSSILLTPAHGSETPSPTAAGSRSYKTLQWKEFHEASGKPLARPIDADVAAIFYTSGSTGRPKGVVLSHRNFVMGASSVASYLENQPSDRLLAALPLSFDAGFSQLTTAFHSGARAILQNYLLPHELMDTMIRHQVTGLTGVPPLWIQLSQLDWPASVAESLRYFANTGGRMPEETLRRLRRAFPKSKPFLMYGLTEAFRATFLPPEEADRRPDSIGKAIPNAEILVLREDGSPCDPDEPGELVQRGALVGLGYWNNLEATAERYKPLPPLASGRLPGLMLPELAVFSGDVVKRDTDGFLYFIGRKDEMIKTSGYRVSPMEVEEILYQFPTVSECAAYGVAHDTLGQVIHVIVTPKEGHPVDIAALLAFCRQQMPSYMVPASIETSQGSLPRNPNGKIDRKLLSSRKK